MKDTNKPTRAPFAEAISVSSRESGAPPIPSYMIDTYSWAYINPVCVKLLDHNWVVTLILWGNRKRLLKETLKEFSAGWNVLQAAHVYGDFTYQLARKIGSEGRLEVVDVVPVQVEHCRRKLSGQPHARVHHADAAQVSGGTFDAVSSYFLLHEVPDDYKRRIVNALLDSVGPGGKAVFMDYHKPDYGHPLKGFMNFIFRNLEPYALGFLNSEVSDYARDADAFTWRKQTYFGGLYQKVVAERRKTSSG